MLPISSADHITSFVIHTPNGLFATMSSAVSRAASTTAPSGTTRTTRPIRSASSASISRPVSISSHARDAPTSRGSIQLTPMSQPDSPMRTNATLNRADCAAMRMSDPRARANPPPAAGPFTAAITGWRSERRCGIGVAMCSWGVSPACGRPSPSPPGGAPAPFRSSPEQKPRPAPVTITTRQPRSASTPSSAMCKSSTSSWLIALRRSGRLRVSSVTPGRTCSERTVDMAPLSRKAPGHDGADGLARHDHPENPPPVVQEVSDGVFAYVQLDGSWGLNNTGFLVGAHGVTALDTCFTERRSRAFLATVAAHTDAPVRTLLNTHHHGDHTHGNWLLPAATIIGHERCREEVLASGHIATAFFPGVDWGRLEVAPPFVTFEDRLNLYVDDLLVELHFLGPAHTTNDVVAWIPERRVLFAGDLVFNGGTPFVVMGSVSGSLASLERLAAFGAEV